MRNIETLEGDMFDPVSGRQFDLIVSNPPFYVTPNSERIFAENSMDLDGLCRRLVKEAPAHLCEGGYFQMLCEWVEIEGQPWRERLLEWLQGIGCDALVFHQGPLDPAIYAETRIPVVISYKTPEQDAKVFADWMNYFRENRVTAIHAGFLTLRRRPGPNWVHFERRMSADEGPTGEVIHNRFVARDYLLGASDEALWSARFRIAEGVRMRQTIDVSGGEAREPKNVDMFRAGGLPWTVHLAPDVASFVRKFDGRRTLTEMTLELAADARAPEEEVRRSALALAKRLVDQGLLTPVPETE